MLRPMEETALVIRVPEAEELVSPWRGRFDPIASRGMPGHITSLYPFVAPDELDGATLDKVSAVLSEIAAWEFELSRIDEFPGAVWLRPEPDESFRALTKSLWRAFPDYPPYRGLHPDSQPHLTLGKFPEPDEQARQRAVMAEALAPRLPLSCRVGELSVFTSDKAGYWQLRHSVPMR